MVTNIGNLLFRSTQFLLQKGLNFPIEVLELAVLDYTSTLSQRLQETYAQIIEVPAERDVYLLYTYVFGLGQVIIQFVSVSCSLLQFSYFAIS